MTFLGALVMMLTYAVAVWLIPLVVGEGIGRDLLRIGVRALSVICLFKIAVHIFSPKVSFALVNSGAKNLPKSTVLAAICGALLSITASSALALIFGGETAVAPIGAVALVSAVIVTPICEELIYRHAAYVLLSCIPNVVAALLTSVAFALTHASVAGVASAFVCGMILFFVRERGKSVLPCIALHAAFNLTSFIAGYIPLTSAPCLAVFTPTAALCIILITRKGTEK